MASRRVSHLILNFNLLPEIHMKKRIIRSVTLTCDARTHAHFFGTRDEILHAEPVPKLLLMPTTWRGDLKPVLDSYLEQLRPLEKGLTLGRTLSAEEVPHVLNIGTAWLGDFRDRILAARDERPGAIEAAPVLAALEAVRREMTVGDRTRVADGLRRLRDAADCLVPDEAGEHGAFSGGRRIADATARRLASTQRIADINTRNHDFHASRSVTPRLDTSGRMHWRTGDAAPAQTTAFRDAMHAAAHAATPREQIAAINRGAKAFWNRGEPITADALRRMPAPTSVSEINRRNRAYWAGRS
jgi:hypothetical protein